MVATKITVNNNGPIRVEGDFEIVDPEGKPFGLAGRTIVHYPGEVRFQELRLSHDETLKRFPLILALCTVTITKQKMIAP